ncbi:hypothetical protein A2U01_0080576, partial [Trifolium medium]|nr:hypothetical protein [Trifolium medium]
LEIRSQGSVTGDPPSWLVLVAVWGGGGWS